MTIRNSYENLEASTENVFQNSTENIFLSNSTINEEEIEETESDPGSTFAIWVGYQIMITKTSDKFLLRCIY